MEIKSKLLNCKKLANIINNFTCENIVKYNLKPNLSILVSTVNGEMAFDTKVFIKSKLNILSSCGINANLKFFNNEESNFNSLCNEISKNNDDPSINGIIVQLPFNGINKSQLYQSLKTINYIKDVDGLSWNFEEWSLNRKKYFAPNTPIAILNLLLYYNIRTIDKHIVIVGKGDLIGKPLSQILNNYPYCASITVIDIFTEKKQELLMIADIIITCYPVALDIKPEYVKEGCIILDAGITTSLSNEEKVKIYGNVHPSTYSKCLQYTQVPGGIGLVTCSVLGFSTMKACLMQNKIDEDLDIFNLVGKSINSNTTLNFKNELI